MEPQAYIRALNIQLTYLFAYTRKINEIDTAAGLFGEFRGMQDAGWNTVATAHEVVPPRPDHCGSVQREPAHALDNRIDRRWEVLHLK